MDVTSEQVWTVVGAIAALAMGWVGAAWKGSGKVRQVLDGAQGIVERMQEELASAQRLIASLQTQLEQAEKLKQSHIEMNGAFESSRNEAWELYQVQSVQAGNAQAMLFRELERAVVPLNMMLKEQGKPPFQINPYIQNVMNDFKEQHVQRSQG